MTDPDRLISAEAADDDASLRPATINAFIEQAEVGSPHPSSAYVAS
ncbi:MAG: hypothetical protein KDJ77_12540 [Rhodobiaceae bacterium]|nr:hypothetical protein [Rhodobiaceae bacterium]